MFTETLIGNDNGLYHFEFNIPSRWFVPTSGISSTPHGTLQAVTGKTFKKLPYRSSEFLNREIKDVLSFHLKKIENAVDRSLGNVEIEIRPVMYAGLTLNSCSWIQGLLSSVLISDTNLNIARLDNISSLIIKPEKYKQRVKYTKILIKEVG